jgi:heptosyltransferase-2
MTKKINDLQPNKILIRSTNWIGDAIMTTPAVRTIRSNFPKAHISVLVHPWVADVFSASPHVDEIINYNKKTNHKGLSGMRALGRKLAEQEFDMAILLQNAFEAALLTKLATIPVRAGYSRDCRGLLLTHSVTLKKEIRKIHQVHYYQGLLKELGLTCGPDELFLSLSDKDKKWANDLISQNRTVGGPIIGLNPGAAYGPAKRWPAEKYGDLAAELVGELDATVVVFGTDDDKEAVRIIKKRAGKNILNLCGKTTLSQAMAMIDACECFVTNDSGLMHVGAALKTPLVSIFGSTNHITTGPFSKNSIVLRKDLSCSPCLKTHCKTDFKCMLTLEAREVFDKVCELLKVA